MPAAGRGGGGGGGRGGGCRLGDSGASTRMTGTSLRALRGLCERYERRRWLNNSFNET